MPGIQQLGAATATLRNARIEGGAAASFDSLVELIDGARTSIVGELFKVNDEVVTHAFQQRARTVPTRLHADSQYLVDPAEFTLGRGDGNYRVIDRRYGDGLRNGCGDEGVDRVVAEHLEHARLGAGVGSDVAF